jgi:hypothetical protein
MLRFERGPKGRALAVASDRGALDPAQQESVTGVEVGALSGHRRNWEE